MQSVLYDAAGHHRSPVTMPGFHEGRAPRNKGRRYPADPPTVEEIIAVMRQAGSGLEGARLRALFVILWRAGLRIGEALDLAETDLDARVVRCWCVAVRVAGVVRSGWIAGRGHRWMHGWRSGRSCPSVRCCAWSAARPPAGTGTCPRPASNWRARQPRRGCAAGSRPISCVMRTLSRWHMRACRWS